MTIEKRLRDEILREVKAAMWSVATDTNEVWISGKQLAQQFSMFGKDWQSEYGHLLPRTRVVIDKDGDVSIGNWAYARNRIQQMIMNNEIKNLKYEGKNRNQGVFMGER